MRRVTWEVRWKGGKCEPSRYDLCELRMAGTCDRRTFVKLSDFIDSPQTNNEQRRRTHR